MRRRQALLFSSCSVIETNMSNEYLDLSLVSVRDELQFIT